MMKTFKTLFNLLLVTLVALMISACHTKTNQDENSTTASPNSTTQTIGKIRRVEVINTTPTLRSITLESNATTVNVGDTVKLSVMGVYSNGSSKAVDENITYTIIPNDSAEMNGSMLTAKKDGNATVQATVGGVNSNTLNLTITWVVNGHTLPPEPDKTLNDSTLLGIDVNHNGVRDDVERWIYNRYKDKHPIHIDIAMQAARGYKLVLEHPERAKEIYSEVDKSAYCEGYFRVCVSDSVKEKYSIERISTDPIFIKKVFDTKDRWSAYELFDTLLSGDSYTIPRCKEALTMCNFNTSKYDKE